jgi:probable phosphoglycerate mutase
VTTFFLTRHAAHRLVNAVLVGRTAGTHLDDSGRQQARRIAEHLAAQRITAVQSSPQPRARETARPIARRAGVPVEIAAAVDEIDVGDWTGRTFAALREDPLWQLWNSSRGSVRPPRGETMRELQARVIRHLYDVASAQPDGRIVMVSHAEVIRAAILHFREIVLDEFWRIQVGAASISTLVITQGGAELTGVNETVAS